MDSYCVSEPVKPSKFKTNNNTINVWLETNKQSFLKFIYDTNTKLSNCYEQQWNILNVFYKFKRVELLSFNPNY